MDGWPFWEDIRPLSPLPEHYRGRFTNVQAAIGLAGLKRMPEFIERTRRHARILDSLLGDARGIVVPQILLDRTHVYYQYCAYVPDSETIVKQCIRRGVDVAPMHVDVCSRMELFGGSRTEAPGAERAATAVQVPVYESLSDQEIERVGRLVRKQVMALPDFSDRRPPSHSALLDRN
jgi:perosamine synthetase